MTIFDLIGLFLLAIVLACALGIAVWCLYVSIDILVMRHESIALGWTILVYALVLVALALMILLVWIPDLLKDVIARA